MSTVSRKMNSRRRLAALSFLSNISLDGTHRDTNLGELNFNLKSNKLPSTYPVCNKVFENINSTKAEGAVNVESQISRNDVADSASIFPKETIAFKMKRRNSENKSQESFDRFCDHLQHRNKDRLHKFVSDAKARLCNLSQKRKLTHQKSIESYGLPAGNSTESLVPGTSRSRKPSLCPSEVHIPSNAEIKFVKSLKNHRNAAERMVLVSEKKKPLVLFSVLPYNKLHSSKVESKVEGGRRRHASSMRQLAAIPDGLDSLDLLSMLGVEKPQEGQDVSYGELLAPSNTSKRKCCDGLIESDNTLRFLYHLKVPGYFMDHGTKMNAKISNSHKIVERCSDKEEFGHCRLRSSSVSTYHPNLLDDPELIAGKHSTLLVFPSYVTSVIDYVKPSDLKKDLNDKFRDRFPRVKLTLSKLRSLKREMYKIARHECNIDLSVVAQAFVYFEKLILKILVNKQNRKVCAGACLMLSAKLNDVRGPELRMLIEKIENVFRINRKDLMGLEFGVLVALEFSLLLSSSEILPHYQRLVYES